MVNDKEFASFQDGMFKAYFEKFIEFKRGKGEKVARSSLIRLRSLNGDLNRYCSSLEISRDVAEAILRERDGEHSATRALRISDLRQFSAFLSGHGIRTYQIPLKYAKQVRTSFRPYIFSSSELSAVTQVVDNYENNSRRKNPVDIYPVIVRILMGTGMRVGEALSLRVKDIEINSMSFTIHCAKNNVSRHVPMSPSLAAVIERYMSVIPHRDQPEQPFFLSHYTGGGYSYCAVKFMFKKFYALAGVRTPQGKFPRIHDLRHTFCTMSLNKMLASGISLYVAVPILSAYVGHVNLIDTERYIHLTEHGYDDFIRKQSGLQKLIPEVASDEA
jgi:integrase